MCNVIVLNVRGIKTSVLTLQIAFLAIRASNLNQISLIGSTSNIVGKVNTLSKQLTPRLNQILGHHVNLMLLQKTEVGAVAFALLFCWCLTTSRLTLIECGCLIEQ